MSRSWISSFSRFTLGIEWRLMFSLQSEGVDSFRSFHVKAEPSTASFPIDSGSQSRGKVRGNPAPQNLEVYFESTRVSISRPRGVFLRKFSQKVTYNILMDEYVWLNNKDPFYLYNSFKIFLSFLISVLVSCWNW